jgi:hypothetical protein
MAFTAGQKVRASDLNNIYHRVGSVTDTTTSAVTFTTDVIVATPVTVSLVNGRKYRFQIACAFNVSGTTLSTGVFAHLRYASGASVTTAGTELFNIEQFLATNGFNSTFTNSREVVWAASSGSYTFGISAERYTGSSTCKFGGGSAQPTSILIDDVTGV